MTETSSDGVIGLDPGPEESAVVLYAPSERSVPIAAIWPNKNLLAYLDELRPQATGFALAIEMVACYGMPVGQDIFETIYWIGRFDQVFGIGGNANRITRKDVKLHLCNSYRAKDANVRQALIDRFGPGRKRAIGRKKTPGPLYGIKRHMWAALAVAVTFADTTQGS